MHRTQHALAHETDQSNAIDDNMLHHEFISDAQQLISLLSRSLPIIVVTGNSVSNLAHLYAHLPHILCHVTPLTLAGKLSSRGGTSCKIPSSKRRRAAATADGDSAASRQTAAPICLVGHAHASCGPLHCRESRCYVTLNARRCSRGNVVPRRSRMRATSAAAATTTLESKDNSTATAASLSKVLSARRTSANRTGCSNATTARGCVKRREYARAKTQVSKVIEVKHVHNAHAHAHAHKRRTQRCCSSRTNDVRHHLQRIRAFEMKRLWVVACFIDRVDDVVAVLRAWGGHSSRTQFLFFCNTDLLESALFVCRRCGDDGTGKKWDNTRCDVRGTKTAGNPGRGACTIASLDALLSAESKTTPPPSSPSPVSLPVHLRPTARAKTVMTHDTAYLRYAYFDEEVYRRCFVPHGAVHTSVASSLLFPVLSVHTPTYMQPAQLAMEDIVYSHRWKSFIHASARTVPDMTHVGAPVFPCSRSVVTQSHYAMGGWQRACATNVSSRANNFFSTGLYADVHSMQIARQRTQQLATLRARTCLGMLAREERGIDALQCPSQVLPHTRRATCRGDEESKQVHCVRGRGATAVFAESRLSEARSSYSSSSSLAGQALVAELPCMQCYFPMVTSVGPYLTKVAAMSDIFICEFSSAVLHRDDYAVQSVYRDSAMHNRVEMSTNTRRSALHKHSHQQYHSFYNGVNCATCNKDDNNYNHNNNSDDEFGSTRVLSDADIQKARFALAHATRQYLRPASEHAMDDLITAVRHYLDTLAGGRRVYTWCVTDPVECLPRIAWCVSYEHFSERARAGWVTGNEKGDGHACHDGWHAYGSNRCGAHHSPSHCGDTHTTSRLTSMHTLRTDGSADTTTMAWQLHRMLTKLHHMGWICVYQELSPRALDLREANLNSASSDGEITASGACADTPARRTHARSCTLTPRAEEASVLTAHTFGAAHHDFWQAVLVPLSEGLCLCRGQRVRLNDGRSARVVDFQPAPPTHATARVTTSCATALAHRHQIHSQRNQPGYMRWRPSVPFYVHAMQTSLWPVVRIMGTGGELVHILPTRTHTVAIHYPMWCFVSASQQKQHAERAASVCGSVTPKPKAASMSLYMDAQWKIRGDVRAGRQVTLASLPLTVNAVETVSMAYVSEVCRKTHNVCRVIARSSCDVTRSRASASSLAVVAPRASHGVRSQSTVCAKTSRIGKSGVSDAHDFIRKCYLALQSYRGVRLKRKEVVHAQEAWYLLNCAENEQSGACTTGGAALPTHPLISPKRRVACHSFANRPRALFAALACSPNLQARILRHGRNLTRPTP